MRKNTFVRERYSVRICALYM